MVISPQHWLLHYCSVKQLDYAIHTGKPNGGLLFHNNNIVSNMQMQPRYVNMSHQVVTNFISILNKTIMFQEASAFKNACPYQQKFSDPPGLSYWEVLECSFFVTNMTASTLSPLWRRAGYKPYKQTNKNQTILHHNATTILKSCKGLLALFPSCLFKC